jgi:hypothetical protein
LPVSADPAGPADAKNINPAPASTQIDRMATLRPF